MHYLIRLRKVLLCDYLYYIILFLTIIISSIRLNYKYQSIYNEKTKEASGIVNSIGLDNDKLSLVIKDKEYLLGSYYSSDIEDIQELKKRLNLGDKVLLKGVFSKTNDYYKNKGIYYRIRIKKIYLIRKNKNIFYLIREKIISNSKSPYISLFILGDKSKVKEENLEHYREIGISHLFAISGMHITLIATILLKILKIIKIKETERYVFVSLFLLFYFFLTGGSSSILRAILFFYLFSINKVFYFYVKNTNIFILVLVIALLINPKCIFEVSFQYSYIISYSLLKMSSYINKHQNYVVKVLITSVISFIVSIPISIYNFNQINVLSILYNVFYIPFVSMVVFPLSIVTMIIPGLTVLLDFLVEILEYSSFILSKISFPKLLFSHINGVFYIAYYILIVLFFVGIKSSKKLMIPFFIGISIHFFWPYINKEIYINCFDVLQGDSTLISINNKNILIDTGGVDGFSVVKNTTIPFLKSKAIRKIECLIITHGDFDHMGEAINLVNNFKVEKVIFNCGEFNDLEQELIKVLDKKKIPYYSCIKELNIDDNKLYFLQTKVYDNENDNSNVIYTELDGYKFMFMGDASITTEHEILNKYNLLDIEVLKVGHHGSKTSSGKEFIDEINPKYSIISVGKNNRYGHPNKEVLDNLEDSKIYRTDIDGSIMFKIKNNKLKIETCAP